MVARDRLGEAVGGHAAAAVELAGDDLAQPFGVRVHPAVVDHGDHANQDGDAQSKDPAEVSGYDQGLRLRSVAGARTALYRPGAGNDGNSRGKSQGESGTV